MTHTDSKPELQWTFVLLIFFSVQSGGQIPVQMCLLSEKVLSLPYFTVTQIRHRLEDKISAYIQVLIAQWLEHLGAVGRGFVLQLHHSTKGIINCTKSNLL